MLGGSEGGGAGSRLSSPRRNYRWKILRTLATNLERTSAGRTREVSPVPRSLAWGGADCRCVVAVAVSTSLKACQQAHLKLLQQLSPIPCHNTTGSGPSAKVPGRSAERARRTGNATLTSPTGLSEHICGEDNTTAHISPLTDSNRSRTTDAPQHHGAQHLRERIISTLQPVPQRETAKSRE